MGLEPHHFFLNISTNTVTRGIQSFGRNGPWRAGGLKCGQVFFVKFAQTCNEQMLKISRRYLDLYLSYGEMTKDLLTLYGHQVTKCPLRVNWLQQIFSLLALAQV